MHIVLVTYSAMIPVVLRISKRRQEETRDVHENVIIPVLASFDDGNRDIWVLGQTSGDDETSSA